MTDASGRMPACAYAGVRQATKTIESIENNQIGFQF